MTTPSPSLFLYNIYTLLYNIDMLKVFFSKGIYMHAMYYLCTVS